jgi:hypothetical protein
VTNFKWRDKLQDIINIIIIFYLFLTANGLTPGGSSTVHIYTQNTENGTYITIKIRWGKKLGSADRVQSLRVISWHLPYN